MVGGRGARRRATLDWPNTQSINYAATKYTNRRPASEPQWLSVVVPGSSVVVCGGLWSSVALCEAVCCPFGLFGWSRGSQTSCERQLQNKGHAPSCKRQAAPHRRMWLCGFSCAATTARLPGNQAAPLPRCPRCPAVTLPPMPLVILKSAALTSAAARRQTAMTMSCARRIVQMWPAAAASSGGVTEVAAGITTGPVAVAMSTPKTKAHCDQMSKWLQGVSATAAAVVATATATALAAAFSCRLLLSVTPS